MWEQEWASISQFNDEWNASDGWYLAIRHVILFHNQTGKTEKISALVI
jgi:hypothetical protein